MLDVHLVHDAGSRRHYLEVVECRLAPAQELVALTVALVFDLDVAFERVRLAEQVCDDGVVNDQLSGCERVNLVRVAAQGRHCFAHGGQVNHTGNTGEVLHDHTRWRELDFGVRLGVGVPAAKCLDLRLGDVRAVFGAKQVLKEHLQAERQLIVAGHLVDSEDFKLGAAHGQCGLRAETVDC